MEKEINDFLDKIRKDFDIINRKLNLIISSVKVDIQLDSIFKKMEYTFGEVLKELTTFVVGFWGVISAYVISSDIRNSIRCYILTKKLYDWFFGISQKKKAEAKYKAINKVNEEFEKNKKRNTNKNQRS